MMSTMSTASLLFDSLWHFWRLPVSTSDLLISFPIETRSLSFNFPTNQHTFGRCSELCHSWCFCFVHSLVTTFIMLFFVLILLLTVNVFTQDVSPCHHCLSSTSCPPCTMTYKPLMPPQYGPTSTVYKTILTTFYNIVDCRYCTVENEAVNLAAKASLRSSNLTPD